MMRIYVNGEEKQVPPGSSVLTVLAEAKLSPEKVAVELNRRLLKSDKYAQPLAENDRIEIVTFVGGG